MIEYVYDITSCPCGQDFTEDDGVELDISIGGVVITLASKLDKHGMLEDIDNVIKNGYHSQTYCPQCGRNLQDPEDEAENV